MERLIGEVSATEALATTLNDELVDLVGDDAKLRADLAATSERVAELERSLVTEEAELTELAARLTEIRTALRAQERELGTVLAALQRMGLRPPPALVADGGSVAMVRGAIALNATVPMLAAASEALSLKLMEADRLARQERDKWTRIRGNLNTLVEERARLAGLREELERRRALSVYERDQAVASLARLTEEADSVRELLNGLERGAPSTPVAGRDFAARRGNLAYPVAGRPVGHYGDPLPAGGLSEGLLLSALPGSTVFAPMPGTVLFSEPFRSYGNVLIVDAGDGYHMLLVGLNEVFTSAGSTVETGAPLGRMGETAPRATLALGRVTTDESESVAGRERPTLYVELRKDGSAFDSHGWWRDADRKSGRTVE